MKRPTDGWRFRAAQILFLSALSGCGTTGVNALSQSTYSVSAQYGSLNGSWSRAQREAVAKAQQYCDAKKETYAFISEQRSGVVGFSPQSSTIISPVVAPIPQRIEPAVSKCKDELRTPELDSIRAKVELSRDSWESPVPFAIATNDAFPTEMERSAIAKWATLREDCVKRSGGVFALPPSATPLQITVFQQDRSFSEAGSAKVGDLIVSLYQQKLTYGEFAEKDMRSRAARLKQKDSIASQCNSPISSSEHRRKSSLSSNFRAISRPGPHLYRA